MGDKKYLGSRLKYLRGKMTQDEVAKRLEISRARYSHYENDRVEPDNEILIKMSEIFEVTTDYLLGKTDNPNQSNSEVRDDKTFYMAKIANEFPNIDLMFRDLASMTAEEMEEVYEYIKFKMSQKKGES